MTEIKKEELVEKVFAWVAKDAEVDEEKKKLLKIIVEMTLDYLYSKGYLDTRKEEKGNGEK